MEEFIYYKRLILTLLLERIMESDDEEIAFPRQGLEFMVCAELYDLDMLQELIKAINDKSDEVIN